MKITEMMSRLGISLILILVVLSGCSDTSTGDDPNDQDPDDSLPTENLSFSDHIQPIFNSRCAACHISQTTNGVRLNNYNNVMNSVGDCYGKNVVIPGEPDESPIVDKISSNSPECGERMPQSGPFLSGEQVQAIRTWITEGAEDN